jgi:hypothetical protein
VRPAAAGLTQRRRSTSSTPWRVSRVWAADDLAGWCAVLPNTGGRSSSTRDAATCVRVQLPTLIVGRRAAHGRTAAARSGASIDDGRHQQPGTSWYRLCRRHAARTTLRHLATEIQRPENFHVFAPSDSVGRRLCKAGLARRSAKREGGLRWSGCRPPQSRPRRPSPAPSLRRLRATS